MDDPWSLVAAEAGCFAAEVARGPVSRGIETAALRARVELLAAGFVEPRPLPEVLAELGAMMRAAGVQAEHPRHFGFFNPAVLPEAALGAALAGIYNPQLAIHDYAPFAAEIEGATLRLLMGRIGYDPDQATACFTTGGAEANLSAVLAALARACPRWLEEGLRGLDRPPMIYLSQAGHDSFAKLVRIAGLGRSALRTIAVDRDQRLRLDRLAERMRRDRELGRLPLVVVGTAGSTAAGAIDPLTELSDLAREFGAWFHVDAAWGGTALLSERLAPALDGIAAADSVTWDAHKWLAVPMGAGMFFCRHPDAVARAFSVRAGLATGLGDRGVDPFLTTMQWSRRFAGLPLFLALTTRGLAGYGAMIDRQADLGERLRELLRAAGFELVNATPLPTVCFSHPAIESGAIKAGALARAVADSGAAFITAVRLHEPEREVLRACITGRSTAEEDLRILVEALGRALMN